MKKKQPPFPLPSSARMPLPETPVGKRSLEEFRAAHDPTYEGDSPVAHFTRSLTPGFKTAIVTSAQNGTPVDPDFWEILKFMEGSLNAELFVVPLRYKNPTSRWKGSQEGADHWAAEVRPYLYNQSLALNPNLTLMGDIKIQPTASSPLTGAEAISLASSGIIGHPKIQTRTVATPQSQMAKLMMTTGSVTVENYSDTRAGRVGAFHHSMSALIVELVGKTFHIRRLHFDKKSKSVIDIDKRYFGNHVEKAPPALALVMGDTHVDFIDPKVVSATFGKGGLLDTSRAQHLVWHDLLDGYACNPHHKHKPLNAVAKALSGADDVESEVNRAIRFVAHNTPRSGCTSIIVGSNHNDFLGRWIEDTDWREDPINARFYVKTLDAMLDGVKLTTKGTEFPSPFPFWFEKSKVPNTRVLKEDESFTLAGVELGMHGNKGPNGARGSIKNLRRIGVKSIIGHSHSPGEDEGCTQVGTSTHLKLEYNSGPSSWLQCHALLNADGKRQLIFIVNGKYRA